MKKIDNRLFQELRRTSASIVIGWLLERRDGFTLGFTSSDVEFTYDGVVYRPTNAFSGTAATSKNNLSVDNMSALALISDEITEKDLKGGLYDNASVKVFWICPTKPELGVVPIRGGTFGEVVVRNGQFETELRASMQLLQQPFGDHYTLDCSAQLGDDRCKVNLEAETWQPNTRYVGKAGADAGIGSFVKPTVETGYWYVAKSAGAGLPAVISNRFSGAFNLFGFATYANIGFYQPGGIPSWAPEQAAAQNAASYEFDQSITEQRPPDPNNLPTGGGGGGLDPWLGNTIRRTFGIMSSEKKANVTTEGYTNPTQSFYEIASTTSGVPVSSVMYLKPTKQYRAPLSALPGTQPMTITNGAVTIRYAIGMSGPTEPAWTAGVGAEVTDGTMVWSCIFARKRSDGMVTGVFSRGKFQDLRDLRFEPAQHYKYGRIKWLTGRNAGLSNEIRDYIKEPVGATIILLEVMPFEIEDGDTFEMTMGCGKTRSQCQRFDNIHNFRGFPDMPTEDKALATPNFSQQGTQAEPKKSGS